MDIDISIPNLISLVIVSHGQGSMVKDLLMSFKKFQPATEFEILIVENTDSNITPVDLNMGMNVKQIFSPQNQGFSANLNFSVNHVSGEYFCIVNPDVIFVEDVFPKLIHNIEHNNVDIVAPVAYDFEGNLQDSFRDVPAPIDIIRRRIFTQPQPIIPPGKQLISPKWISGLFLFMKKNTFKSLGGFDVQYKLYFEDVEFCCRARQNGYILGVDPSIKIIHNAQRKSHRDIGHLITHIQSAKLFYRSKTYLKERELIK